MRLKRVRDAKNKITEQTEQYQEEVRKMQIEIKEYKQEIKKQQLAEIQNSRQMQMKESLE